MIEKNFKEFLELTPPNEEVLITDYNSKRNVSNIATPDVQLHCTSVECRGIRFFEGVQTDSVSRERKNNSYIKYICRNCKLSQKIYALSSSFDTESQKWIVKKYAEEPFFGSPTPSRVYNLIGAERDLFLLGRRSENQGMGIGAFVYYRRVIESQKSRIFDELIRVVGKISPNDVVLEELVAAKKEIQFTKAVDSIKHSLPQSLNINGYNPLTLLHSALSEGVHAHTDTECLELAGCIRTVLFEFADRLGQALKEEAELNAAVTRLANKKKSS